MTGMILENTIALFLSKSSAHQLTLKKSHLRMEIKYARNPIQNKKSSNGEANCCKP